MTGRRIITTVLALALAAGCGSTSEEGLYSGSGGKTAKDGSLGGAAGAGASGGGVAAGGSAGLVQTGGSAGIAASAGSAGVSPIVDAGPDVPIPPPVDAGPDGNDPVACPPNIPVGGSPCNIFVNQKDCIYGFKHCVCSISTWLCVP